MAETRLAILKDWHWESTLRTLQDILQILLALLKGKGKN